METKENSQSFMCYIFTANFIYVNSGFVELVLVVLIAVFC